MTLRVSFELDDDDLTHFRLIMREARKAAARMAPEDIVAISEELLNDLGTESAPGFIVARLQKLKLMIRMITDLEWRLPHQESTRVLNALAYFAEPEDLIPDHIPGLGFLDDAIMVKFIGEEFKHELAGYRKFRRFRRGAEQRPWTRVAQERLPRQLAEHRKKIRAEIAKRKAADADRRKRGGYFGW